MHFFMPSPRTSVARGAALLDDRIPDWFERVDPLELDMNSVRQCILGQICGDYLIGCLTLGITSGYRYGFYVPVHLQLLPIGAYDRLEREWKGAIAERRIRAATERIAERARWEAEVEQAWNRGVTTLEQMQALRRRRQIRAVRPEEETVS